MATLGQWLLLTPLWVIFLVLCGGLLISAWLGSYIRRKVAPPAPDHKDEKSDQADYVLTSVMGLLALLVGFTFALAIDRYDARRGNVVQEANAIGTTYLRAQLLQEPHRARLSRLLVEYTDNRIKLGTAVSGAAGARLLAKNDQFLTDLWTATVAAFPSMRPYDFSSSFLETMNQLIDMDAARKAARRANVPAPVFALLFLYQFVTAAVLGYIMIGRNGRWVSAFLLFLFALSVIFIIDIDRPVTGIIRETQEPMIRLQASMHANTPQVYDRFNELSPAPSPTPAQR